MYLDDIDQLLAPIIHNWVKANRGPMGNVLLIRGAANLEVTCGSACSISATEAAWITVFCNDRLRYMWATDSSKLNMYGGRVKFMWVYGNTRVTIAGGSIDHIRAYGRSRVTLWGSNFRINGVSLERGKVLGYYQNGLLTGTLRDGKKFCADIFFTNEASIFLECIPKNKIPRKKREKRER